MKQAKAQTKPTARSMTPEQQHARFVEAAKAAEADESPRALDRAFGKLNVRAAGSIKKARGTQD